MKRFKNFSPKPLLFLFVLFAFALSIFLKLTSISRETSIITYDQGRDLLDIRHMWITLSPRLVGPTTSINGVLLGPFWYYFNLIPFILSGGNPTAILVWQIIWYIISAICLYSSLKKINPLLASITTVFYLFLPTGFYTGRYFWNANSMPFFTGLYFAAFLLALSNISRRRLFWLGFISGLCLQIEAAFGVILFPFAFLYLSFKKIGLAKTFFLVIGFTVTLLPQVLFEFRHGFIMTKLLINSVMGRSDILGQKMIFSERLGQRTITFLNSLRDVSHIPERFLFPLFLFLFMVFIYFLLSKKIDDKIKEYFLLIFTFLVFTTLFFLIFPQSLKVWYTLSFSVPLVLLFSLSIFSLTYLPISRYLIYTFIFIVLLLTTTESFNAQTGYIKANVVGESDNPSLLRNELTVIDKVFELSAGQGFKVYNFVPAIYDYAYQYLFWWYGTKKFGYQPADIAYLPNQPEYIEDHLIFWKKTKPVDNDLTLLIIEKNSNKELLTSWLGNFSKLCEQRSVNFSFNTEIRVLTTCSR